METSDPDDLMTLCLLANHSKADLLVVTVTPGIDEQIGLVKTILNETVKIFRREVLNPAIKKI